MKTGDKVHFKHDHNKNMYFIIWVSDNGLEVQLNDGSYVLIYDLNKF